MHRRDLMTAGIAFVALASGKALAAARRPVVVSVFMRGGADGMNIVPPYGDDRYQALRPTIAIPRPGAGTGAAIDLDGFFGLHPSMAPLMPMWQAGELAVVQACGMPRADYSHFTAEIMYERASLPETPAAGGWLGRALEATGGIGAGVLRGVSVNIALDHALAGSRTTAAIPDSSQFRLQTQFGEPWQSALGGLYDAADDVSTIGKGVLDVLDFFRTQKPYELPVDNGATYPADGYGYTLMQAAQYIKADVGISAIGINIYGWDTHAAQASAMPGLLDSLAGGLAAFRTDLGERFADVVVTTMSEFGRTAGENASLGTDHGFGNMMLVMGPSVRGGHVYHDWPGLRGVASAGDLTVTTDYRNVLGEVLTARFGVDPGAIFPGLEYRPMGLMR